MKKNRYVIEITRQIFAFGPPDTGGEALVAFYDYGKSVTVTDGETFTIDFSSYNLMEIDEDV